MYKTLTVAALLLAVFAFTSGSRSADASPTTAIGPAIVAKGKLVNQTAPIPTTSLFTPTQSGLFRLSAYATITTPDPNSSSSWDYSFTWTDDSGLSQGGGERVLCACGNDNTPGTFTWQGVASFGTTLIFQAKAGIPVTYTVTQDGPVDASVYAVYYTIERLE